MKKIDELIALHEAFEATVEEKKQKAEPARAAVMAQRQANIKNAALVHWAGFNHGLDDFLLDGNEVFNDDFAFYGRSRETVDLRTVLPNVTVRFGVERRQNPLDPERTVIGLHGCWPPENDSQFLKLPCQPETLGLFFKTAKDLNQQKAEREVSGFETRFERAKDYLLGDADDVEKEIEAYAEHEPKLGAALRTWWAEHQAKAEEKARVQYAVFEPFVIWKLTHGPFDVVEYVIEPEPDEQGFWTVLKKGGAYGTVKFRGWRALEEVAVTDPDTIAEYLPKEKVGEHMVYVRPPAALRLADAEERIELGPQHGAETGEKLGPATGGVEVAIVGRDRKFLMVGSQVINLDQVRYFDLTGPGVGFRSDKYEHGFTGKEAEDLRAWLMQSPMVECVDGASEVPAEEIPF